MKLRIAHTATDAARALTEALLKLIHQSPPDKCFQLALSGGATPAELFLLWSEEYADVIPWDKLHLYWVDERCVSPDDAQSNYGMTLRTLLRHVLISPLRIHRILGEADPEQEALRYSRLVDHVLTNEEGYPVFDCVLLGIGIDGHTSSIFPGQEALLSVPQTYVVSTHPMTGQKRIALTGLPILHARKLFFFIIGTPKAKVLREIILGERACPAAYLMANAPDVELFVDAEAAVAL